MAFVRTYLTGNLLLLWLSSAILSLPKGIASTSNVCGLEGIYYEGECFWVYPGPSGWVDAGRKCRNVHEGAHLATITDQIMNDVLRQHVNYDVWIGLHDIHTEGVRKWVDETFVNYTNFDSDDDGNDGVSNCVMFRASRGTWEHAACNDYKGRLCAKRRAEPLCSDGGFFFRDRCYWPGDSSKGWNDAMKYCERFGEGVSLPVVHDAELNLFLSRLISPDTWLGLHRTSSSPDSDWHWINGDRLNTTSFQRWDSDQPNEEKNCVKLTNSNRQSLWHTALCMEYIRFVCTLQPCSNNRDGDSVEYEFGSGDDHGDGASVASDEEISCRNYGSSLACSCIEGAVCRIDGTCTCEPLFSDMTCDTDDLRVTVSGHVSLPNTVIICHVNLPPSDVTVIWHRLNPSKALPAGRTTMHDHPDAGDYLLNITDFREIDYGLYVCSASTNNGKLAVVRLDSKDFRLGVGTIRVNGSEVSSSYTPYGNSKTANEKALTVMVTLLSIGIVLFAAFVVVKMRLSRSSRPETPETPETPS